MMKRISILIITLLNLALSTQGQQPDYDLIDKKATKETKSLYRFLHQTAGSAMMFGHQDTDAYGTQWKNEAGRSDVKDVCGSHAAIHGWDLGNEDAEVNLDSVPFVSMRKYIIEAFRRGGVNTISWHLDNPVTGNDSWNKQPVVSDIIPGGKYHDLYVKKLKTVADFLNSLETDGIKVPVIFRPFHEHNGDWFWWGKGNCMEQDYISLFRFTVDYLKDTRKLHHIIYAFSPDRSRMDLNNARTSYLYGYPGDDYIDILGMDNYMDVGVKWNTRSVQDQREDFQTSLVQLTEIAKEKNKVAALTETGLEGVSDIKWFTNVLATVKNNPSIRIAYMLVWRNGSKSHHYAPYPGHPSSDDFVSFYQDPFTLFENDLTDLYKIPLIQNEE